MTATGPAPDELSVRRVQRRDREEIEALASRFVSGPVANETILRRRPAVVAAAAGAVTFALLVWILWPGREAPVAHNETTATVEASAWQQQYEAQRERRRKELESSAAYRARMAAADTELLRDLTARAQALADREHRAKPATGNEPTPKAASAKVAPAAVESARTPAKTANAAPAKPAPVSETPKAAPEAALPAAAASASCSIHVADLSSSGTLTYDAITRMRGAHLDPATGHVFTPPVPVAGGRSMIFEVMPDGCVRIVRKAGG